MENLFNFTKQDFLGSVINVDSEHVIVQIENESIMAQICVGNLMAIETSKAHQLLIASIDRVTRKTLDDLDDEDDVMLSADYVKASIIGTFHAVLGEQKNLFKRGIEAFPKIDSKCDCILGTNLQKLMNILSNNIKTDKKLKLGNFVMDAEASAILDGNKFFQRHAAILGSTGSGKSWCVANILEKSSELNFANIIVFDMHGEYSNLALGNEKIAESFRIAGPADLSRNSDEVIFLPYWLLNREELLSMVLDRSDMNAPNQASRFTSHINSLKEKTLKEENKNDVLKTFTVDSPIPFEINELIRLLKEDDTTPGIGSSGKPIKGEWQGKLTRFISRLEAKIQDKRYGFMFQPNLESLAYGWLEEMMCKMLGIIDGKKGIKIIDFSEVPSDVLPVVTGTLARLLYNVQFWIDEENRTPFTIICDEAHLYLPVKEDADSVQKQALYNFERIAKEGRKYGVSILAVSQRPADVSKTILSQCSNFIVLRLTNERDKGVIKNLLPDSLKSTIEYLPLLDIGEALVVGDAILLPSKIKLDKPKDSHQPLSGTKDFWDEWDMIKPNNNAIKIAIESLRKQSRS